MAQLALYTRLLVLLAIITAFLAPRQAFWVQVALAVVGAFSTSWSLPIVVARFLLGGLLMCVYFPLAIYLVNFDFEDTLRRIKGIQIRYRGPVHTFDRLLAVLSEELAWRVAILGLFDGTLWIAVVSLLFTLIHFVRRKEIYLAEVGEMLVFSLILAYMVRFTGDPWTGVGFHFIRNFVVEANHSCNSNTVPIPPDKA